MTAERVSFNQGSTHARIEGYPPREWPTKVTFVVEYEVKSVFTAAKTAVALLACASANPSVRKNTEQQPPRQDEFEGACHGL